MDITVEHVTGASMIARVTFDYLTFTSKSLDHTWKRQLKGGNRKGSLRLNGKVVCAYEFEHGRCMLKEPRGEWMEVDYITAMCD